MGRTLEEHHRIISAMREGRADLAKVYAAAHVAGVEAWVIRGAQAGDDTDSSAPVPVV